MQPSKIQHIIFRVVPALFLCFSIAACGSSQKRADAAFGAAQQQMTAGNIAGAAYYLRQAVQIRDDIPDIWLALGQVEQRLGNLREAYIAYNRADELRPSNADTLRALSYAGYIVGASRQAGEAADRLLVLAPNDPNGLIIKGMLALDDDNASEALRIADAILTANADDASGIMLKARALANSGDVKGAQLVMQNAIAKSGENGGYLSLVLQIYRVDGDIEGLRSTYPALLKLTPDNNDLYVDYANFLFRTGDPIQARKILFDGLLKERRNGPYIAWAFSVLDRFQTSSSTPILDPRMSTVPASLLRTTAARYLLERGDPKGAATLLLHDGQIDPADRGLYAAAIDAMGQHGEAVPIVDTLLVDGKNQDADALLLRSRWALAAGNHERAIIDSQAAVVADPSNAGARLMLSRAYSDSNEPARARQVLVTAANDLPANRLIVRALLDFLHKTGDKAAILGAVRTFADANASDPGSWDLLATTCAEQGNTACAESARAKQKDAQSDFDMPNPNRPNLQRGLFSPLKRKTQKT